jgi:hypothetical protein
MFWHLILGIASQRRLQISPQSSHTTGVGAHVMWL